MAVGFPNLRSSLKTNWLQSKSCGWSEQRWLSNYWRFKLGMGWRFLERRIYSCGLMRRRPPLYEMVRCWPTYASGRFITTRSLARKPQSGDLQTRSSNVNSTLEVLGYGLPNGHFDRSPPAGWIGSRNCSSCGLVTRTGVRIPKHDRTRLPRFIHPALGTAFTVLDVVDMGTQLLKLTIATNN